ncbi:hypothetical protein ACQPZX_45095 [Actinoplanes sp. CA-142083]|uniref:hypothetical protein n=1 Tax=Actinoplanes sp. CA-142083 TaxID=3239903 RepID=UPI003D8C652B
MEIYTMTQRPSMPLTRACAPSAIPAVRVAEWKTALLTAPVPTPVAVLAAERAPVSRVHQVQVQAELAQALTLTSGINGSTGTTSTTGFKGIDGSKKRYTDGANGVPPRGRPV